MKFSCQNQILHEQTLSTYHIKDVMGRDLPSPPINSEELETNWHFFKLRIAAEELKDQNHPSQPKLQPTESNHSHSTMEPKMRGSMNDATKAKACAAAEAKKKSSWRGKENAHATVALEQYQESKIRRT